MKNKLFLLLLFFFKFCFCDNNCDMEKANEYYKSALGINYTAENMLKKELLYKKAIEICPSFAEAHNNLGDVYERQGKYLEAVKEYDNAIKYKGNWATPYFGKGDVYYKTGRYDEAKKWYQEGLKYDKNDTLTKNIMKIMDEIENNRIVKTNTIVSMLSNNTRGVAQEVPISFGEGLIPFDFNKYEIKENAKKQLNEIGEALKTIMQRTIAVEGINYKIEIAGHTDCRGTDEYNLNLSFKRAEAVVNYLVENFELKNEIFEIKGYGERNPIFITNDCVQNSREEAGHSLNRRVEIVKVPIQIVSENDSTKTVRAVSSFRGGNDENIRLENAFFYKRQEENSIKILNEDCELRSQSDKYFIYFKPLQDCYVYIVQEDSKGKIDILFPKKNKNAKVLKDKDYWVPNFGSSFTLDSTKGEEKIYLLATSFELKTLVEGLSDKDLIMESIDLLKTRGIKVTPKKNQTVEVPNENSLKQNLQNMTDLLEGGSAFVRVLKFKHI